MSNGASTLTGSGAFGQYFDHDYAGPPFDLFGTGHLVALAVIAAVVVFLVVGWKNPPADRRRRARYLIATVMLLNEVGFHAWNILGDAWTLQDHLPLHACSISIWGSIYVLFSRNYRVYEILFFIGIAGAVQALITPSAGVYGLPHYRALQTMVSHGMIVIALVYMTSIEGFRPTWASVWKTMLAVNGYMVIVTLINLALGSNYMYTLAKPVTASLLDVLGPWPWYLLAAEIPAIVLFSLLYLPFAIRTRKPHSAAAVQALTGQPD